MGKADSSVRRVYSGAGQTRTELTRVFAKTVLLSDKSGSIAINKSMAHAGGTERLRQQTIARGFLGFAIALNTVSLSPYAPEFQRGDDLFR